MPQLRLRIFVVCMIYMMFSATLCASDPPTSDPSLPVIDAGWEDLQAGSVLYMEVPLIGTFGDEITYAGFESALTYAAESQLIRHVVFVIDSGGGDVETARMMMQLMNQYRDTLTYHAYIRSAISASIWIALSCDHIWMTDASTIGGALAYKQVATGNLVVDEKMNSILVAEIIASADRHNRSRSIIEAMTLPKATLELWKMPDGKWRFGSRRPPDAVETRVVDGPTSILTMTQKQAIYFRLARAAPQTPSQIGSSLNIDKWRLANRYGAFCMSAGWALSLSDEEVMRRHLAAIKSDNFDHLIATVDWKDIRSRIQRAMANDPERSIYFIQDNKVVVKSAKEWKANVLWGLANWSNTQRLLESLHRKVKVTPGWMAETNRLRAWSSFVASQHGRMMSIRVKGYDYKSDN